MIRLTHCQPTPDGPVIRIDGSLDADTAEDARRLVGELREPVTIDLAGLTRIDRAGLAVLLDLHAAGATLRNGSLYVAKLLKEAGR